MSETAKKARADNKAKAKRIAGGNDPRTKSDSSSWVPSEPLNAEARAGLRPVSPRAYKRGGKVAGAKKTHAGRKPRKAAGGGLRASAQEKKLRAFGIQGRDEGEKFRDRRAGNRMAADRNDIEGFDLPDNFRESRATLRRASYKRKDGGQVTEFLGDAKASNAKLGKPHVGGYADGGSPKLDRTMTSKHRTAKVYKSSDGKEYLVRHYEMGEHVPEMDKHYSDRHEAHGEADNFARSRPGGLKDGGRAHKLYGGGFSKQVGTELPYGGKKKGGKVEKETKHHPACKCRMCSGGKIAKADGGNADGDKWIQGAAKHKGSLHKALHVPEGKKIPAKKTDKAAKSDNPKLAKKANLAKTLEKMPRADGGKTEKGMKPVGPIFKSIVDKIPEPPKEKRAKGGRTKKDIGGGLAMLSPALMLANGLRGKKEDGQVGAKRGGKINDGGSGVRAVGDRMPKADGGETSEPRKPHGYHVIDRQTGKRVGRFKNAARASSFVDKKDNDYGAYRYSRRPVYDPDEFATGGRAARKRGGKTGKTQVNIVINGNKGDQQTPPPMPMVRPQPPIGPAPGMPPGGMPPGMPPGAPTGLMGPGGPQPMPPMGMPRKRGGRASYNVLEGKKYNSYKDMDAGALGGKGRLEKVEIQKRKG